MSELQKIDSFQHSLAISETIEEIKICKTAAEFYLKIQKDKGIGKRGKDEIGEFLIECEKKEADWLNEYFPHGATEGKPRNVKVKVPNGNLKMPVSKKESARVRKIKAFEKDYPDKYLEFVKEIRENRNTELSPKTILKRITGYLKELEKENKKLEAEKIKIEEKKDIQIKKNSKKGWYKVGNQFLYFGSNLDDNFLHRLPQCSFAFADPPYNAGVANWDSDFKWQQDYLQEFAKVVAVTPGGWNAYNFYQETNMEYVWEMCCWIKNGMTHGKCGFANFIKTSIFSKGNVKIEQDFFSITVKTNETGDTYHKGRKPYDFMIHLIQTFTKEGDYIIDPFSGSGTTLLLSEKINRVSYNAEIDEDCFMDVLLRAKSNDMNYERI